MLKKCNLSLKSIVDGAENVFSVEGKIVYLNEKLQLSYREEAAAIQVTFYKGKAWVERDGDYSLRLTLEEGFITKGELGINGNVGELDIFTHAVACSLSEKQLTARLRYDILLGEDAQEMELIIQADMQE